jgi:Gpi18-like mannosyltransferase
MSCKKQINEIASIIAVTTLGTFLFSYVAFSVFQDRYPSLLKIWNRWDTAHYLDIAERGYSNSTIGERHLRIVFLPLYPLLIRLFNQIFNNYILSALMVSNLAYIVAAFYLYKLVLLDYEEETALKAVFYFSIFPTAYFLHAGYTESPFLALTISSFYYGRKGNWSLSGLTGMLASATRMTGIILLPALILEYMYQRGFRIKDIKKDVSWLALIPIGLASYLLINYMVFGDLLRFLDIEKGHWSKALTFPWKGLVGSWGATGSPSSVYGTLVGWAELAFGLLVYVLAILALFVRLRPSYILYMIATWLVVTSTSFLLSTPRYALSVFPVFITLSLFGRRREADYAITFTSLLLFALFLTHFVLGRWAF